MNLLADPVKSSKVSLSCTHSSPEVTVTENDKFNLTMFVIDTTTQQQLPNITWSVNLNIYRKTFQTFTIITKFCKQNFTWQAKVQMYRLGHYPAKGALSLSNAAISFDTTTGYTLFSNLAIDRVGMYLLSINIYTTGNEFSSQCYTNTITVIKSLVAINVTNSTEPNYKLRFKDF